MQLICIVDGAFAFYTGTEKFWTITRQSRDKITTSFFFLFVIQSPVHLRRGEGYLRLAHNEPALRQRPQRQQLLSLPLHQHRAAPDTVGDVTAQLHAHAFQRLHGQLRGVQLPQATQHSGSVAAAAAQPRLRGDTLFQGNMQAITGHACGAKEHLRRPPRQIAPVGGDRRIVAGQGDALPCAALHRHRIVQRHALHHRDYLVIAVGASGPHIQRQVHLGGRQFLPLHAAPSLSLFSRGLYHRSCGNSIVRRKFVKNGQDSDPKGSESCGMTVEMLGLS